MKTEKKQVAISGRVDDELKAKVKAKAAEERTSIQELIVKWSEQYIKGAI